MTGPENYDLKRILHTEEYSMLNLTYNSRASGFMLFNTARSQGK